MTSMDTVCSHALQLRGERASRHSHASGEGMGVDDCTDEHLGWDSWIDGPFEVHGVPAHHYSILRQPQVARVATLLSQAVRTHTTGTHTTGTHTTGRSRCSRAAAAEEGDKPP